MKKLSDSIQNTTKMSVFRTDRKNEQNHLTMRGKFCLLNVIDQKSCNILFLVPVRAPHDSTTNYIPFKLIMIGK